VLLADPQRRAFEVDEAPLILQQLDGGQLTGPGGDGGDDETAPTGRPDAGLVLASASERGRLPTRLSFSATLALFKQLIELGVMASASADQRRAAGERTRARLMDAALDRLAVRGEEGATLRDVTDTADANVAAVSYHFGSLQSLFDAAIAHALERYLDAQQAAVNALPAESTLEELAVAFARPMISALTKGGRDRAAIRIVARAAIDPPQGWDRFDDRFDKIRADVVQVLKKKVSGVKTQELIFRIRCAAGMLNWLALAPVGAELSGKSEKQSERLLVPILVGAFRGTNSG
jgi:AcrR family transcriptional regulator